MFLNVGVLYGSFNYLLIHFYKSVSLETGFTLGVLMPESRIKYLTCITSYTILPYRMILFLRIFTTRKWYKDNVKILTRFCLLLYIYELIFAVFYNGKHLTDLPYTCSVLDELIWSNEQSCPHEHFWERKLDYRSCHSHCFCDLGRSFSLLWVSLLHLKTTVGFFGPSQS